MPRRLPRPSSGPLLLASLLAHHLPVSGTRVMISKLLREAPWRSRALLPMQLDSLAKSGALRTATAVPRRRATSRSCTWRWPKSCVCTGVTAKRDRSWPSRSETLCKSICICTCICICICICICRSMCLCLCICTCICVCVCVGVDIGMRIGICRGMWSVKGLSVYVYVHVYVYIYIICICDKNL